jgi:hypothetical protein
VLDNAVNNNEIYVTLCESVQQLEPQLQRLHGLLTNLRALLAKLREVSAASEGGATGAIDGAVSKGGHSTTLSRELAAGGGRRLRMGGKFNLDPPELAPVLPVRPSLAAACSRQL